LNRSKTDEMKIKSLLRSTGIRLRAASIERSQAEKHAGALM